MPFQNDMLSFKYSIDQVRLASYENGITPLGGLYISEVDVVFKNMP